MHPDMGWQRKAASSPEILLPNTNFWDLHHFLYTYLKDILATDIQFWFSLDTFINLHPHDISTWLKYIVV